jgi:ATP-binding cassette subfamily B multidrug efflux pump
VTKLLRYLKPIWWKILIAVVLMGLQAYFALLVTNFMSNVTTIMENPDDYASKLDGLVNFWGFHLIGSTGNRIQDVWIVGGVMMGFAVGFLACAFGSSVIDSQIGAYYAKCVRHDMFHKVTTMAVGDYYKFGTASLITRTTNDIEQTQNVIQMGLRIMIMSPVSLVVAIVLIATNDPNLGLIVACVIPFMVIVIAVLLIVATPLFKKIQVQIDKVTAVLRESLKGVRVIRAFNQENRETERFRKTDGDLMRISTKSMRVMSFGNPLISIAFDATYIAIYFYGFSRINGAPSSQAIDFANIVVSAEYAMQLMQSFMMFMFLLILVPRGSACAKRINEVLDLKNPIVDPKDPKTSKNNTGLVEFKDVTFAFPGALSPSLSHISFTARPGKTTAIIGSTGSGKSTVISLIPRFYDVSDGQVLVDGVDIRDYKKEDLRNKLGYVPQTAQLFKGTLRENIAFGKEDASDEEINKALEVAQATEFVSTLSDGLNHEVEQDGKNFSGGQKQRLSIARALVKKPEIYVFDDSFSALDFKTDVELRKALKGYTKDASIIIVAQRISTIIDADNIIVLEDGKIVGSGTHKELLSSCPVYQEIVYSQLDKEEVDKTLALTGAGGSR